MEQMFSIRGNMIMCMFFYIYFKSILKNIYIFNFFVFSSYFNVLMSN